MAKLTDSLQSETRGRETINPGPSGPSIFEGIAKGVASMFDAQAGADQTNARADARARQARQDARQAEADARDAREREIDSKAADIYYGVFEDDQDFGGMLDEGSQKIVDEAAILAGDFQITQSAVQQGRMTPEAYELKARTRTAALLAQYPNDHGLIYKALKDNGVNNFFTRDYDKVAAQEKNNEDSVMKVDNAAFEWATTKGGFDPNTNSRDQLIRHGREGLRAEAELDLISKRTTIASTNAAMTREDYQFQKTENADESFNLVTGAIAPKLAAMTQRFAQLANDPTISDTVKTQKLGELAASLGPAADAVINDTMIKYGPQLGPRAGEMRSQLQGYRSQLVDMMTGPLSTIQQNSRMVTMLQNTLRLNSAQTFPLYTELKQTFGGAMGEIVTQQLMSNPELVGNLSKELKGFTGISTPKGKLTVQNVIGIIKGERGFKDMTPQQARELLPTIAQTYVKASDPAAAADPGVARGALHSLGQISNAAVELNNNSGIGALTAATQLLTRNSTVLLLANGVRSDNAELAKLTAPAARAATQQLHNAWQGAKTNDTHFDVVYDKNLGAYKAVSNGRRKVTPVFQEADAFGNGLGLDRSSVVGVKPTDETIKKVNGLNSTLNMLVSTAKAFEDDVPIAGATTQQLRQFYTNGVPLPGMKDKATGKVAVNTWEKNVDAFRQDALGILGGTDFAPLSSNTYQGKPDSRATRNNNPGNLRVSSFTRSQPGFTGESGGFATFASREAGHNAQVNLLKNYHSNGRDTLRKIVARYAPGSDNNDENGYVGFLRKQLNIGPDDKLSPSQLAQVAVAMQRMEG